MTNIRGLLPLLLGGLLFLSNAAYAAWPTSVDGQPLPSLAPMLKRATPAVVNISTRTQIQEAEHPLLRDPFFRYFFDIPNQPRRRETSSLGSGVIVDARRGYILTNNHVIDKADEIMVTLSDGRHLSAKLVGADPESDIAVIKVEADNLTELPVADSSQLQVGDFVVAIGNPFGLGQTVTSGIISALGRSGLGIEGYEDFIQTDASINPGNSGGALVDFDGNLIGINTAIIAPSGGNVGIGFAVPINMAKAVVDQLIEYGEVRRGMLGVQITDVTPDIVEALELKVSDGAVVQSVTPGSPAEKAGIQAGDVIVSVNGQPIKGASDLRNTIGLIRAGTEVRLGLLREDQRREVKATIGENQQNQVASSQGAQGSVLQGATFGPVPSDDPNYGGTGGVLVTGVEQGSRAWNSGLRAGDIITAVNRQAVRDPRELQERVADQGTVALNILRDNQSLFLILR